MHENFSLRSGVHVERRIYWRVTKFQFRAACQAWYCHICQPGIWQKLKQTKYCHICQPGIWQKHKQTEYCRHRFRVENRFVRVWVCRRSSVYFDMLRIFQSVWRRFYEYQNKWQTINKGRYAGGGYSGGKVGTRQGEKCKKMQLRNTGGRAEKCNKGAKMQAAAGRK